MNAKSRRPTAAPPGERPAPVGELIDALRELGKAIARFDDAVAGRLGVNATDRHALDLLGRHGPLTAGGLGELAGLTSGAVTGVVDRLERAGFVRRVQDPADRRRVVVELLPARRAEIESLRAPVGRAIAELSDAYSDRELAAILDFAADTVGRLRAETAKVGEKREARGSRA